MGLMARKRQIIIDFDAGHRLTTYMVSVFMDLANEDCLSAHQLYINILHEIHLINVKQTVELYNKGKLIKFSIQ